MKVLANGGLNLSELDGWWAEAYAADVGWAIGDGREHGEDPQWDAAEADALYTKLEQEIIPLFYYRDDHGLPIAWIERVRESMARLTPQYSADRTVREYTEKYYLPAAVAYSERAREDGAASARILRWQEAVKEHWASARFGPTTVETRDGYHHFQLQIELGDLVPDFVRVDLYADALPGGSPEHHVMTRETGQEPATIDACLYSVRVPAARPSSDYTPRLIPYNGEAIMPLEAPQILWQR
jgi:starch phosphorylase